MRILRSKICAAMVAILFCVATFGGMAFGADIKPLGINETYHYKIQIYARTGGYVSDVTRPLTANGSIKANLTSTSGVSIRVCDAFGSRLTSPKNCYKGTTTVFINSYAGKKVDTKPEAKALNANHSLGGTWTYRYP